MKTSEYIKALRENFFRRLDKKTGWGKKEVKAEFDEANRDTTFKCLERRKVSRPFKNLTNWRLKMAKAYMVSKVVLELTEEEAVYIKDVFANPIYGESPEPEDVRILRHTIWEALDGAGV